MGWRRGARVTGSERDPGTRTSRARARARARPAPRASPKNTQVLAQEPGERGRVTPLYLAKRKGFVALALAHGAPLVPAFAFGLEKAYDAYFPRGPLWTKVARQIGFLPLVYWGWPPKVPYGIARPCAVTVVFGSPIATPPPPADRKTVDPALVEEYHAKFVAAMVELFDRHKAAYGPPGAQVRII